MNHSDHAYVSSEWVHEEKRRYYCAWVQQDLFSDWVLCCRWGSLDSARGGQKTLLCHSKELGATLLQKMEKRRASRGYCDLQSSLVQTNENLGVC